VASWHYGALTTTLACGTCHGTAWHGTPCMALHPRRIAHFRHQWLCLPRSNPASFQYLAPRPAAFLREYPRWTVCGASSGARDGLGERSGIPFGSPLAIIDDKCNLLHARTHMRRQADECEVTRASSPNGKRHCPALTQPMGIASVVHTARRFPSFLVGPMQGAQGPRCRRCQANASAFAQGNHPPAIARDASKEV
jgi:hypothetical protein